jgi:hypothetical protein
MKFYVLIARKGDDRIQLGDFVSEADAVAEWEQFHAENTDYDDFAIEPAGEQEA